MVETSISYIERLANGIIRVETKANVELSPESLDENWKVYHELLGEEKGLFLVIFQPGGISDKESREKFASPERSSIKKAEALVVKSLPHLLESNFYVNYHQPGHPAKVFRDEASAIQWLERFL